MAGAGPTLPRRKEEKMLHKKQQRSGKHKAATLPIESQPSGLDEADGETDHG